MCGQTSIIAEKPRQGSIKEKNSRLVDLDAVL